MSYPLPCRIVVGLVVLFTAILPSSASAFPYLTLNAARRAIIQYERKYWAGEYAVFRIGSCDHETLDPILVWCRSQGTAYPEGGQPERWDTWDWAELLPDDRIEVGEEGS